MQKIQVVMLMIFFLSCNRAENAKNKSIENILHAPAASTQLKDEELAVVDTTTSFSSPPQAEEPDKQQQVRKPSSTPDAKPDWNKKIIKTASLNVEVKSYQTFNHSLHASIEGFGGYISDEQQTETSYKIENIVTIKVPVDQFQSAVDFLTTGEGKIVEKKISSEDVTSQYVDTKSRLEAKKQVRLRYLDLLKQAKNMEEVLQVQQEINEIQEEIEAAAGRINYLQNASAMSTIQLSFSQVLDPTAKDADQIDFPLKIKQAFIAGWEGIGELFVGLIYIWPLVIVVAIVILIGRKFMLRRKKVSTVVS